MTDLLQADWLNCYDASWQGEIVPEAFSHPAKYARGLIRRIYEHILAEGWVQEGDVICDPFGGVALGGLDAMLHGLNWVGVELEEKFVALGNENIALWNKRYQGKLARWGSAVLLQGDSRELGRIVERAGAVISSPPYTGDVVRDRSFELEAPRIAKKGLKINPTTCLDAYGHTSGNLGNMRATAGGLAGAISSPPWENNQPQQDKTFTTPHDSLDRKMGEYGDSPGQLGQETGTDFWTAARQIAGQLYQVLAPGAHAVWVVKSFVKNKAIVDFPGQWQAMCEAAGFRTVHIHRAWLVKDKGTQIDLEGNHHRKIIARKSFFRRLAEAKGSPAIDYEIVLCMQRP